MTIQAHSKGEHWRKIICKQEMENYLGGRTRKLQDVLLFSCVSSSQTCSVTDKHTYIFTLSSPCNISRQCRQFRQCRHCRQCRQCGQCGHLSSAVMPCLGNKLLSFLLLFIEVNIQLSPCVQLYSNNCTVILLKIYFNPRKSGGNPFQ